MLFVIKGTAISNANVITPKTVECECSNSTQTNSQDKCEENVVKCSNSESDRPSSCYVLWGRDNVTGSYNILH